jgi:hypothetical protein
MSKKHETFEQQLRRLVDECPETRYRIGENTGIDHATLSRFMAGKGGLSIPKLNALIAYLGLELRPTKNTNTEK